MSIFKTLLEFSLFLDTEEDYKIFLAALYKLCERNVTEIPELRLIQQVTECAVDTAQRTGNFKNYFSMRLGEHFQTVATTKED